MSIRDSEGYTAQQSVTIMDEGTEYAAEVAKVFEEEIFRRYHLFCLRTVFLQLACLHSVSFLVQDCLHCAFFLIQAVCTMHFSVYLRCAFVLNAIDHKQRRSDIFPGAGR